VIQAARSRKLAPLLLVACALGVSMLLGGDSEEKPPPEFEPGLPGEDGTLLVGSTWTKEADEYAIRLQKLTDLQRLAYIKHVTGLEVDPFLGPPDKAPRYISFILEIENRGEDGLGFHPRNCWLSSNKAADTQTPMALSDLSFDFRSLSVPFPQIYEQVGPALLEQSVTVAPGQSVAGLLVYRAIHERAKRFNVDVQLVLPSGDVVRFSAPYQKIKEEKG
jgi:hypothetical protein